MKNIPVYYSPADFANNNNNHHNPYHNASNSYTSIPMKSSETEYTQHSQNFQQHPTPKYRPIEKRDGYSTFRLLFFIAVFCISGVIIYFTLNHVYGGSENGSVLSNHSRLYKRSIPDDPESVKFTIIVFGWKRRGSLERLVNSLESSDYLNKTISIRFQIDADPSEEVKTYVNSYHWPHGEKKILFRSETYGLKRMIIESWNPKSDDEYAFFFEDDTEVSPLYFKFTWELLMRDDIFKTKLKGSIVGIALNTPRFDEVNEIHSIWTPPSDGNCEMFLFQQPCSWGALYFPWSWREFLQYYKIRTGSISTKKKNMMIIPSTSISMWKRSWKKYFMELMFIEGNVMIYPALPNQESFAVHHREPGQHTNIGIEKQNIMKLHTNKVDYFASPLINNEKGRELIEKIKKGSAKVSEWPIVSFHHIQVESIEVLKTIGNMIFKNYFQQL